MVQRSTVTPVSSGECMSNAYPAAQMDRSPSPSHQTRPPTQAQAPLSSSKPEPVSSIGTKIGASGFSPPKNVSTRRRSSRNTPVVLTAKLACRPEDETLNSDTSSESRNEKVSQLWFLNVSLARVTAIGWRRS